MTFFEYFMEQAEAKQIKTIRASNSYSVYPTKNDSATKFLNVDVELHDGCQTEKFTLTEQQYKNLRDLAFPDLKRG